MLPVAIGAPVFELALPLSTDRLRFAQEFDFTRSAKT
jgi:hypothetical protein